MLKTALSIYFSVLYTGIHIDTKGNLFIVLFLLFNLIKLLHKLKIVII
jgi:hypothetical protein